LLNPEELQAAGFTVKKFCGLPVDKIDENHYVACDKEAAGELTFIVEEEDGTEIPINVPVCADCLQELNKDEKYSIQELDNPGGILLD
jgi:hydrogenase maturation factor HypF (carbamoyltransferase family)